MYAREKICVDSKKGTKRFHYKKNQQKNVQ